MSLNTYEKLGKICQDDPYEDVIDESYESEARKILEEIQRRKKERIANKIVFWLKEGFLMPNIDCVLNEQLCPVMIDHGASVGLTLDDEGNPVIRNRDHILNKGFIKFS